MLTRQINFEGAPLEIEFTVDMDGNDIDFIPADAYIDIEIHSIKRVNSKRDVLDELGYHIIKKIEKVLKEIN